MINTWDIQITYSSEKSPLRSLEILHILIIFVAVVAAIRYSEVKKIILEKKILMWFMKWIILGDHTGIVHTYVLTSESGET